MKKRDYPATRAKPTSVPWDEIRALAAEGLTAVEIKRRLPSLRMDAGFLRLRAREKGIEIRKMSKAEWAATLSAARSGKPRGAAEAAIDAWGRWTGHGVAELTRLWATKASARAIAKHLGVSHNSVLGKAHRLGLAGRPSPINAAPGPRYADAARRRAELLRVPAPRGPVLRCIAVLLEAA